MMKIVLIGATGTIGKAVANALEQHELIQVGYKGGDYQVNIESRDSISALFDQIGEVDAIVSTAGAVAFSPVKDLTYDQFKLSLDNKLMGQLNLFQIGQKYVREGGSITLSSGVLAQHPMEGGAAVSLVNAALDSFAKAAAFELGDSLRVNTVSPHFVKETMEAMGMDSTGGISAADTAKAYKHAVSSKETGQAFDVASYL
ncbi:short chain dehydrogenase [Marinomonas pollencensis]|uniref:NAD(P)-dependent dehydrogenase (Short-subunit alcohol dehydrogenase family) n=1 Tax=Marinomonas pollencensis TaxID=491954 RepID=A0A3E0DJ74_9GAMM|nr:short chain dehydrogenase [Marinomonas pollencensis]REG82143.1 NAD(P)-dependent dehydrogenase (short-subunit alcohol dehydrogenase family) [Marinomonas pollencensis]